MLFAILFSSLFHFVSIQPPTPRPQTATAVVRTPDTIYWQSARKLTWDDFRGQAERSGESVALTSSGIGMAFRSNTNGESEFNVTCTFFCRNSWVKAEGRNDSVLQHEQLHFDLTELYARRLRQALDKLPAAQRKWSNVQKIYNEANRDCDKRQNDYDDETRHGIRHDVQQKWNGQIEAELKQLESYKSGD